MNEDEIKEILDRVAPKRRGDRARGELRMKLHVYLKAGKSEAEAIRLAQTSES